MNADEDAPPIRTSEKMQKNELVKDVSDDALSSNYPNSSRSTVRDITCSSISSSLLASSSAVFDESDAPPSAPAPTLAASDSFEYENAADRQRIQQMEQQWKQIPAAATKGWRSPEKERRLMLAQRKMLEFMHQNEKQMRERREDDVDDDDDDDRAELVEAVQPRYGQAPEPMQASHVYYNNVSVHPRMPCCQPPPATTKTATTSRHKKILFTPTSYAQRNPYADVADVPSTDDNPWLRAANRFGTTVLTARRERIGRHFGPAKNPACQCDHCRRWMAERDQHQYGGRGRALSMGDEPFNRSLFWLSRH